MDIEEYAKTIREFAIYPEAGTGGILALAYCGLGLGEAGEVQGKIKKILRDDSGVLTDEKREAILAEVGDLVWYVVRILEELGSSLPEAMAQNAEKLQSRKDRGVLGGSGDNR